LARGVISFLIVLAFLLPILELAVLENKAAETAALHREDALFLQRKNALELDLKNALRQALQAARGSEREEMARDAAAKIAAAEAFLERYVAERGAKADLWVGVASESEIAALLEKTRAARSPAKCAACFDLATPALDSRGKPAPLALAFLDADAAGRGVRVSRNGLSFVPAAAPLFAKGGAAGIGATLYFPERNAASVVMLPEGFGVEKN
jgi:hypothetical protein